MGEKLTWSSNDDVITTPTPTAVMLFTKKLKKLAHSASRSSRRKMSTAETNRVYYL